MRTARVIAPFVEARLKGLVAAPKAPESPAVPVIGTHDGSFHCDEAMACGLLRVTEQFANATVVRTRIPDELAKCTTVVDVGSVYDADALRYDHHQKEFQGTMTTATGETYKTRLSSAGLVYKHYGLEILKQYVDECVKSGRMPAPLSDKDLALVHNQVYRGYVEHVDGIDNGVEHYALAANAPEGASVVENYKVPSTLSDRVGRLYPYWNEEQTRDLEDQCFVDAVKMALTEFLEAVDFYVCSWLPAQTVVSTAFAEASKHHASGSIVVLDKGGCPWKGILLALEEEAKVEGRTLYVLYPDGKGGWRIQCVPKKGSAFLNRKSLPWKGLRDAALSEASGVEGGVFIHVSGFIGGNKSFEGAMAMAVKAVEMKDDEEDVAAGKRNRE